MLAAVLTAVISKSIHFFFIEIVLYSLRCISIVRIFSVYLVNYCYNFVLSRKVWDLLCITASGVAILRNRIGVQFPFDVLAGIILGGLI